MIARPPKRTARCLLLLCVMVFSTLAAAVSVNAGKLKPPSTPVLRLQVDKPIIHLGESVSISGFHFTPGAAITISLHGPQSATPGRVYSRFKVARGGDFMARIAIPAYPDAAARQWHTILIAVLSSAIRQGMREGAAIAVQADPMPCLNIVTRARLSRTSLVIDGTVVPSKVTAKDSTHYRISYAGHLRAGVHSAYLKWSDAEGAYGAHAWTFRIGSPYAVSVAPSLSLSARTIRLGALLGVAGRNFTPGAAIATSLGGPNEAPATPVAKTVVDATGAFDLRIRIARYPSAAARAGALVYVAVVASGPMVGDLPESVAAPVQVTG